MTGSGTRRAVAFFVGLMVASGAVALALSTRAYWHLGFGDLRILGASLVALGLLNVYPVTLEWKGQAEDVSLEEVFFVVLVMVSPPMAAILAMIFATLSGSVLRRRPLIKSAFNVGTFALMACAAVAVARSIAGTVPVGSDWRGIAGAGAGALVSSVGTSSAVRLIVTLSGGLAFRQLLSGIRGLELMMISSSTSLGAIAGIAAIAQPLSLVLIFPLLLVIGFVLHQHARAIRDRVQLDSLLETAVIANRASGVQGVRDVLVEAATRLLHSAEVSLQIEPPSGEQLGSQIESSAGLLWLVARPHPRRIPVMAEDQNLLDGIAAIGRGAIGSAELLDQVRHQAFHDSLTGLPNRILFEDRVAQAIKGRTHRSVAVLFIDLDRFKRVNDSFGHRAGDQLLRELAGRILGSLRVGDSAARLGGDEFAVLVPDSGTDVHAMEVANRIIAAIREPFTVEGREVVITASIGVAVAPTDGEDFESLLRSADLSMYEAKAAGRDGVRHATVLAAPRPGLALEADLRRALEQGELWVAYQPQIRLATRRLVGVEALVRWNHPTRGLLPPDEFLPLADEIGLLGDVDALVLRAACQQLAKWRAGAAPHLRVAVNLSDRHLRSGELQELVSRALRDANLPARALEIEVTEKVVSTEGDAVLESLSQLRALGATVAIDDFGTGYSSLSRLRTLPVDVVKIDQSFVREILDAAAPVPLVTSMISMAHGLGLEVIAEGVETPEQVTFLTNNGCDMAQGYLLGMPRAAEQVDVSDQAYSQDSASRRPADWSPLSS